MRRCRTHSPETDCLSIVSQWLGHIQRMDRICNTPNLERYIKLNITINNPYNPIEGRDVDQFGTLGARVDCIYYIPVA